MNQASLKSYLSIQKDLHQGKGNGQKRTQTPLIKDQVKKQKMTHTIEKFQLLSPEKTPLTSPQKLSTISSKLQSPKKFYDIDKIIESPIKSLNIKPTNNLFQTQIDSFTQKKTPIINIKNDDDNIEIVDNNINNVNIKSNLWEKNKEKNIIIEINQNQNSQSQKSDSQESQSQNSQSQKSQNVEDFLKDIFNSTEQIKNKHKIEHEIKQLKPQLPQHEVKLKAGISSIDLSKNIIPLLFSERKLKLPEKYEKLQKLFEALDHILRYDKAMNRQSILFSNLIKRLENICHCNVSNKQLGQIMRVYPESYYLRAFRAKDGNINWYIDFKNSASALEQALQAGKLADIRRKTFRQNLLNYVYKEYDKFIEENRKEKINDYTKLTSWDPEFNLENVPDIEPVELPQPPLFKNQLDIEKKLLESKPNEPKPLLRKSDLLLFKERIKSQNTSSVSVKTESQQSTLNNTTEKAITSPSSEPSNPSSNSKSDKKDSSSIVDSKTRGEAREKISALRLRLREKDRLRKLKQQQTPAEVRKNTLIGRLPDVIKTLKKYYVSKKTTSLPYNEVKSMLQISCNLNSFSGVDEHIKLLIEINIECCRKVPTVNYGVYLKFFPDKVEDTLKKIEEMKTKISTK
ncbi:hypothetical protein BCR36DRAFT_582268 [Piromyces finnis]|uniref:CDT1 Geminin-binding domain-containing protein n=1 Tax=Piromyces finnis TaxID=1754191 RepID=A0A1Y1VDI1_9FUNG|nr:hypothetical protein BCR36DRAFT_582268 [Piromyces finnis]|eukprot:ORX53450.1 hypothetical protein BCR36DRAFT_582268 [Piromyces finnis]